MINYRLNNEPDPPANTDSPAEDILEQEYYKTALTKLGGSIAFIMKDKTFLWKGDSKVKTGAVAGQQPPSSEKDSDG